MFSSLLLAASLMIDVRPSQERGYADHGWLRSHFTFSFADYYDPSHMGFHTLRVINEDVIAPKKGFDTHPHRNMEILTVVLKGAIAHKDSMGHETVTREGEVQLMSAGSGIRHSEYNPSAEEETHLFQIWIQPSQEGLKPSYQQRDFAQVSGSWVLIASPGGKEGSLTIHQDANVYLARLEPGSSLEYPLKSSRHAWLQVAEGEIDILDKTLKAGDGAAISEESAVMLNASKETTLLLFDLG